jgi:hypothetical protein
MLQAIAALKFAQLAKINDCRFCSLCRISTSTCVPFNNYTFCSPIVHSYRTVQLFQQQKVPAIIYSACLAVHATQGLTPFVLKNLFNKNFHQAKITIMLPKIVCQSTDLDVVKKELVDAEQSM